MTKVEECEIDTRDPELELGLGIEKHNGLAATLKSLFKILGMTGWNATRRWPGSPAARRPKPRAPGPWSAPG